MPKPNPPSYVSFIPDAVLHDQLNYKRSFYSEPDEDIVLDRAYPYLNGRTMTRFVDDCTSSLLTIYAALQDGVDLESSTTALAVLDKNQITPYSPPWEINLYSGSHEHPFRYSYSFVKER